MRRLLCECELTKCGCVMLEFMDNTRPCIAVNIKRIEFVMDNAKDQAHGIVSV